LNVLAKAAESLGEALRRGREPEENELGILADDRNRFNGHRVVGILPTSVALIES
jgi:hypothetical protein